jgi:Zn-dependent protease/predicted transcriptional regulator
MPWSVKIARIAGVNVYLHFTFLLLMLLVALAEGGTAPTFFEAAVGVLFFVCLFTCVLAHEFGHILMARRFGVGTRDVTLLPIGGVARLEKMPDRPRDEFWVALAGPAVNVVIAGVLLVGVLIFGGGWSGLVWDLEEAGFVESLILINTAMILFNLLPAFPMDGGRVLRAMLASRMDFVRATQIAARLGRVMAVLFVVVGVFWLKNPFLFFIALVVWFGAGQEANYAILKSQLKGITVKQAMITEFHQATPEDSLGKIAEWVLAGTQTDYPIVNDSGQVIGILGTNELFEALKRHDLWTSVRDVMKRDFVALESSFLLEPALNLYQRYPHNMIPVVENGVLTGMLTMDNVAELIKIRQALNRRLAYAKLR